MEVYIVKSCVLSHHKDLEPWSNRTRLWGCEHLGSICWASDMQSCRECLQTLLTIQIAPPAAECRWDSPTFLYTSEECGMQNVECGM